MVAQASVPACLEVLRRFSEERDYDTVTRRMVAVGRHGRRLVMVPYERENDRVTPVTVHATTRQQIDFRLRAGRLRP